MNAPGQSNRQNRDLPLLLLPVENQVRELDAKLLLAMLAASRGYSSVIGWKGFLDQLIGRFPPSIYFAKSISQANTKMLRIKRKLGHFVIAWDEEALVRYPDAIYHARRIGAGTADLIDLYVAWGDSNANVVRRAPGFAEADIRTLGNPRADFLRPDLAASFSDRVAELQAAHGEFILINTNFGSINGYTNTLNLMRPDESGELVRGRGAKGMPEGYPESLFRYRTGVFEAMQSLIAPLARRFPERKIVIRPHPAENHDFWRELGAPHTNVEVCAEGNVVPWLMAAHSLIHNNCTTAVEGFLLGTKIVTFSPEGRSEFDFTLANELGHISRDVDAVLAAVADEDSDEEMRARSRAVASGHIASLEGQLATERIVDLLEECRPQPSPLRRLGGRFHAEYRRFSKRRKQEHGVARYGEEFRRQRFPELAVEALVDKSRALARAVPGIELPRIDAHSEDLWTIHPRD